MHSSASAPCLTRRPLLKGGTALLGLDYEETLQILRHQQRVENMKPSAAVQRQEQERDFQRHRRFVQIRSRYAQPTSAAPAHSSGRLPESGNRRDFEKRLERMLLKDWDGKEQDFAWKRCPPKEQRVPMSRPRLREVAPGAESGQAEASAVSETEPNETHRFEAARNETSDMQQGGLEKDDTLKQKEAEAQVTNSYAGFGNPGAGGGAKPGHLRPPDFRSILQSDNASSGPGASLDSGGNGLGGFGADAGMNLKPPNFQMQTDTSSALNAGAAMPSLSQQNDFASGPALKPLHSADEVPESIGGFGEQAAGGVGGGGLSRERRMRPPDFRSILQSDNASSGPSEPVPFGNQGNDGGLVLKPLGSLNGGGNGLGGFGADAGMNLKPPNFQMQTDTSSALNAGAAMPSLSQQNDFASGPALKPLHSADEVPESIGGFGEQAAGGVGGGGLSRERRMRPPDFRSILQSDNASSGPSEPVPFGNQGNHGGLVLKPLGSLNGGGHGLGGFGADAGMNLKPPNFQMQTDTSSALNAGSAIPSLSQQNDFASGPALKPLHSADEVPESIGGFGSDFAGPGAIKSTAGPVADFFKEENGYVPSVAAAGGRRRRPRAGQL